MAMTAPRPIETTCNMADYANPFESGQLTLQLFDLRREAVLREARDWFPSRIQSGELSRIDHNGEWPKKRSVPHGTGIWLLRS